MAWQPQDENREEPRGGEDGPEEEREHEAEGTKPRTGKGGKGVIFFIIAVVLIGAIAAGIWWAVAMFGNDAEAATEAVGGYFEAGARNDRETANRYIYTGEDAQELGADDFSGPFDPEVFFAFREVQVRHAFAGEDGAYVFGSIEYNERPSREFTAVLRQNAEGWGMLRLWLAEPQEEGTPASVLVGAVNAS